jgi:aldose sugar dehydrogenase
MKIGTMKGALIVVMAAWQGLNPVHSTAQSMPDPDVRRSEKHEFRTVLLAGGLANPWGLEFLPDGRLLISERSGSLKIREGSRISEISGLPAISTGGQGGLLDILADRNFAANRILYFTFSKDGPGGRGTAVAKARLDGNSLRDVALLWEMKGRTQSSLHFGSRIRELADGSLAFTTGERGSADRAQNLADDAGKVHRIAKDGSIPADNPFVAVPGSIPSVFSYGHRNAQGLAIHPDTGAIWLTEHGPQGGDELNVIRPGKNYGWPVITHGRQYGSGAPIGEGNSKPGMEQPVLTWTPSIAPSGLAFYTGSAFPGWKGNLFSGNLAGRQLVRMELAAERVMRQEKLLVDAIGRIRDVKQGPDGLIYLITDERNGGLYRLEPTGR